VTGPHPPYVPSEIANPDAKALLAARSAVKAAKAEGAELSQNTLIGLMQVKGAIDIKRGGIDLAVARGALRESPGPRRSRMFAYVKELDEHDFD